MGLLTGLRDFRFSRVLFQEDHGMPKLFALSPTTDGETVVEAEHLIQRGGGAVITAGLDDEEEQSNVIKLCEDAEKDLIQYQGFVPISFLRRCILRNFYFDPQKFRRRIVETYTSHEEQLKRQQEVEGSDDDMGIPSTFMRASSSAGLSKGRMKYTDQEDLTLIEHVVRYGLDTYKGRGFWKKVEHRKLTTHTCESMRSRFLKTILPHIGSYRIPKAWKRKLGFVAHDDSSDDSSEGSPDRDDRGDDDGGGDNTSSVVARRESMERETREITPGLSLRDDPPHKGNTLDTPSTSRHAHGVSPTKSRRGVTTIPAMFTRPSRARPVMRQRETTDSDDDDCVIVDHVPPEFSKVRSHRTTKQRSTSIRCCPPTEGLVIRQCLSQGYISPVKARKLQVVKLEEEEEESRSREKVSWREEEEKCDREEGRGGREEIRSGSREDERDGNVGKRKATREPAHKSDKVCGGEMKMERGSSVNVDDYDDGKRMHDDDNDDGERKRNDDDNDDGKRKRNDDDGKRKLVWNEDGDADGKRQAATKAPNRRDCVTCDTRVPEQVVVTDNDADVMCDTASEDLVLRLICSEDENEEEEGKQEKKKEEESVNKKKNSNIMTDVRVLLKRISTSCLSDVAVSSTVDDGGAWLPVCNRKCAGGVAQESRSRSRWSPHTSTTHADTCHEPDEQEERAKGSPTLKVMGSPLRPTFRTKMPLRSSKADQGGVDVRRAAAAPGRKLSSPTSIHTNNNYGNDQDNDKDKDTDSNSSIAGSAVSTGSRGGVSWRMLHQPSRSTKCDLRSGTQQRFTRVFDPDQPSTSKDHDPDQPSTSKDHDEEGGVDVHTCVSKDVTKRRVQAVARHYKIGVSEAVELMIRNQDQWWPVFT